MVNLNKKKDRIIKGPDFLQRAFIQKVSKTEGCTYMDDVHE